jgi:hypothetical protein
MHGPRASPPRPPVLLVAAGGVRRNKVIGVHQADLRTARTGKRYPAPRLLTTAGEPYACRMRRECVHDGGRSSRALAHPQPRPSVAVTRPYLGAARLCRCAQGSVRRGWTFLTHRALAGGPVGGEVRASDPAGTAVAADPASSAAGVHTCGMGATHRRRQSSGWNQRAWSYLIRRGARRSAPTPPPDYRSRRCGHTYRRPLRVRTVPLAVSTGWRRESPGPERVATLTPSALL